MKKYYSLGELFKDYRQFKSYSQTELASILDVDVRTIIRWEKNETLINLNLEKEIVELLNIPYQIIRNLNTDNAIPVYFDIKTRTYSLSALMMKAESVSWYNSNLPVEDERIHYLSKDSDIEFVTDIQEMYKNLKPIKPELVRKAAELLPELNLVLHDQSGYYAGHITILPLKYDSYEKIKNRTMNEGSLTLSDFTTQFDETPLVFYFYSLYADTIENSYYLMNRLLSYFREKKFNNCIHSTK